MLRAINEFLVRCVFAYHFCLDVGRLDSDDIRQHDFERLLLLPLNKKRLVRRAEL
jgi:hypothetical protein